jgi:hypothetical protein
MANPRPVPVRAASHDAAVRMAFVAPEVGFLDPAGGHGLAGGADALHLGERVHHPGGVGSAETARVQLGQHTLQALVAASITSNIHSRA